MSCHHSFLILPFSLLLLNVSTLIRQKLIKTGAGLRTRRLYLTGYWVTHTKNKSLTWAVDLIYRYIYTLFAHIHISQLQDSSQNFQTKIVDLIARASQYKCSKKITCVVFHINFHLDVSFILKTVNLKGFKCNSCGGGVRFKQFF